MNKKLEEALKRVKIRCHPKVIFDDPINFDLESIEQALKELDDIKNANPNEALEVLDKTITPLLEPVLARYEDDLSDIITANYFALKQALLKAQENEKKIAKYKQLEEKLGCPLEKLIEFSNQSEIYTKYGVHTDETVLIDFNLNRIHITKNRDINDIYTLYTEDYKKTWWLKENKEE